MRTGMDAITLPKLGGRKAKKRSRVRVPVKRSINLATVGEKKQHWLAAIPAIALIVAAAAVFSKYLVMDRLQLLSDAQSEVRTVQQQLDSTRSRIESFGELNDVYAHYTYSGMTQEELNRVDRVAALELLERVVLPRTAVESWTLSGNTLTLSISGSTLEDINETVQLLLAEDIVAYSYITGAQTVGEVTSSDDVRNEETVRANLVIELENPPEEEEEA